jgi:hypothetical protein
VHAIPPVLRPLLFLVVPLLLIHQLSSSPGDLPRERVTSVAERRAAAINAARSSPRPAATAPPARLPQDSSGDFPRAEEFRSLLEKNSAFLVPKRAACPASGVPSDLERFALFKAFRAHGYLEMESLASERPDEMRVDLNAAARNELGSDLREGPAEISVIVAKKEFIDIAAVQPPPNEQAPPLRTATRIDFNWRWAPTNALARYLGFATESNGIAASAYVRRQLYGDWIILDIHFHDQSADLTIRR